MIVKNISSDVDLLSGNVRHTMTVCLQENGQEATVPVSDDTYHALTDILGALRSRVDPIAQGMARATAADVEKQAQEYLEHRLSSVPMSSDEQEALGMLKAMEAGEVQTATSEVSDPNDLLRSVGFIQEEMDTSVQELIGLGTGTESDEQDPGEQGQEEDDGVEAY